MFINQCTTIKTFDHHKRKRRKRVVKKYKPNDEFGTLESGMMFFADFQAKMNDNENGTFGIENFTLFE